MLKYPTEVKELPAQPFFAVLEATSFYIEGDERSRTNPGHGYPAHTEKAWKIVVFSTEDEWKRDVEQRARNPHGYPYKAVKIVPATVAVTTSVAIT